MTAVETILALLLLLSTLLFTVVLMWVNNERKKRQWNLYGLPRCYRCKRVWDEHTNIGACPNGSGSFYVE